MRKNILVLYHTDLDGAMSAAVVGMRHRDDNLTFRLYNYGWEITPDSLQGFDLIYAVDISFFQGGNAWVYETPGLTAIDHHIGAIREEEKPEYQWVRNVPGLRVSEGRAACELTWEYLFPGTPKPLLLEYLSAYDVWDKTRFFWQDVEEIEFGAKNRFGLNPRDIINFLDSGHDIGVLKEEGKIILRYLERKNKNQLKNGGFYIHDFFGYRVLAFNTQDFTSMTFKGFWDPGKFDIMMPFALVPKGRGEVMVRVSLYTENPGIDVSRIAETFGGSGHKGAAGFTMNWDTLRELILCTTPLKDIL